MAEKRMPLVCIILDGWGIWEEKKGNAITLAKTPNIDNVSKKYPMTLLNASGKYVGVPDGQPGNSEAGHMNIGAGRIVEQDNVVVSKSINTGTFFRNPAFLQAANHVNKHNSNIHLMGLLSNGSSPHSDDDHLLSLISLYISKTKNKIYLHLFTDGRDSPPYSALKNLGNYKNVFDSQQVKISTVMGRFYAMDRKKAWDRTKMAYEAMVNSQAEFEAEDALSAVSSAYNRGESDEYIKPTVIKKDGKAIGPIKDNDAVIFFNFRSDRARQLTKVFGQEDFEEKNPDAFKRENFPNDLIFVALTDFGPDLENIFTAYPGIDVAESLPYALKGYRQLYVAETEKYAHITYFFNGGYDHPISGEVRINVPSKDVVSYAQAPEMSTLESADRVIQAVKKQEFDFILINFASPDMVGHTGDLKAAIQAIEYVDDSVGNILEATKAKDGVVVITADHGNVEEMINLKTGEVDTQHSINLVPFIIVDDNQKYKLQKTGSLSNVAPTLLDILGVEKPQLMVAESLIKK